MSRPEVAQAAVMTEPSRDLEIREYPIPAAPPGGVLVKVQCCTICRSDLHTWLGRRPGKTPAILGHEIVGEVVELGAGVHRDSADQPLHLGDRVTWTLHSSCGKCCYCQQYQLSMKCRNLKKYGHEACDQPPYLTGGFAEYCVIDPGTCLLKLPANIPGTVAAPLNCAVATIVAGYEAANLQAGENVLIQGAGGLGCYAAAYAKYSGAKQIIVTDINPKKLDFVRSFGATECINVSQLSGDEFARRVCDLTDGFGADLALELAGIPEIVPPGLKALRTGGRYIEIGCSFPESKVTIDLSLILWKLLTVQGVHNYDFRHLRRAVDFVSQTVDHFPYESLVPRSYGLSDISAALHDAETTDFGRIAIEPGSSA